MAQPIDKLELLRRAYYRLKLINGDDAKCCYEEPQNCPNHNLMYNIEATFRSEGVIL